MPEDKKKKAARDKAYGARPEQKKNRAARNKARRLMEKAGKVHKGDGKDIDHKDSNPKNNKKSNLKVTTKKANRGKKDKNGKTC